MADDTNRMAKVLFRLPEPLGSLEVEILWARPLGSDKFAVENLPFYVYGVSLGDIVLAPSEERENLPKYRQVLSKSGNRTLRILFELSDIPQTSEKILHALTALGCGYEGANGRLFAVDVPPASDLAAVTQFLTHAGVSWESGDPSEAGQG